MAASPNKRSPCVGFRAEAVFAPVLGLGCFGVSFRPQLFLGSV